MKLESVRLVLGPLGREKEWPARRRLAHALKDTELAEALALEQLGKRRPGVLRVLQLERERRAGITRKSQKTKFTLPVEVRL